VARAARIVNVHPEATRYEMRQLRAFRRIPSRIFLALDTNIWYRIRHH
jgi:hypothetical protein